MKKQFLMLALLFCTTIVFGQKGTKGMVPVGPDSQWLGPNSNSSDTWRNGDVYIGTNPIPGLITYKLSVNGKVRATSVKVYNDWADFVFEENYDLPTLESVETHIKEYGHLENIPSAAEVEADGIDLGQMDKLLLQKVEELTLYIIELNKKIDLLEQKQ